MFHVEHCFSPNIYIRAVHYFQTGTVVEGDESTSELLCRIMINRVNYPTKILSVEFADLVDVFYPDGDVFDFHSFKTLRLATKAE